MKNTLIADAGSTKVEWVLLNEEGQIVSRLQTHGINALLSDPSDLQQAFLNISYQLEGSPRPEIVYYYGAGCATPAICRKVEDAIHVVWREVDAQVGSDLLAACRGLLGREKGIVCILGTGSNSCIYDGEQVVSNVPPLGYILGDEGSGAALGKRLVSDAFKGHLPKPVTDKFKSYYELTLESILDYTYKRPGANRFLASLVPFIKDHIWNPYLYSLVLEEFTNFIKRNVAMYPGSHTLPLVFTGGVADAFPDILTEAAERQGFKIRSIEKKPMEGLIRYHSDENN